MRARPYDRHTHNLRLALEGIVGYPGIGSECLLGFLPPLSVGGLPYSPFHVHRLSEGVMDSYPGGSIDAGSCHDLRREILKSSPPPY